MPRLSKDHARTLADLREIASRSLSPGDMGHALIVRLEHAIGWDGYRLFGFDSRTLLINRLLAASDNDTLARREWLEGVYLDERTLPYLRLQEIARARLRAVAYQPAQEHSWGYPAAMLSPIDPTDHRTYYFESESPVGGTIHATFECNGRQIAVLQAYRRDPGAMFRPTDVRLVRQAAPIIGSALGAALARERSVNVFGESIPSGVLLVSSNHSVEFSTPAGAEWLRKLHTTGHEDDASLPAVIWSAVKGLAHHSQPALRLMVSIPSATVEVEATPAGNGTTAIVIFPQSPEPQFESPEHWGLTPQQSQIVIRVIGGSSNREIASQLFLSEHTVEWHLRQIFRALDLSSRSQLQARFFREVGLAGYQESSPQ